MAKLFKSNWDPTDKKFNLLSSYSHILLHACKVFPEEATTYTCVWFPQGHKVCNSTSVLLEVQLR